MDQRLFRKNRRGRRNLENNQMNTLLATDVYKMGHMEQYAPGTDYVYSYLCARSDRYFRECVFFGLQYYLKEYLTRPPSMADAAEFLSVREAILGQKASAELKDKLFGLAGLGYWPVKISAMPEGTVVPVKNALLTVESTDKRFPWVVGFIESMLLKVWYPITCATNSYAYRAVVDEYCDLTGDGPRDFMVHDFGYRSDTSEESAAISGAAHLLNFCGSDTVPAMPFIRKYYGPVPAGAMLSVPASEHSVMCSYGVDNERAAFQRLMHLYPTGFVSIVSDTYDIWKVCTEYMREMKSQILSRDGKVVIRPDSGNPPDIICGSPLAPQGTPESKGVLRLLDEVFGSTTNELGYKVLNPHIGLIYGDGMYLDRYKMTLARMKDMGYAASNLVIGCGGILRQGTRDTLGMALKATRVEINGEPRDILKAPITDPGKRSHTGFMQVYRNGNGVIVTKDQATREEAEQQSLLKPVFKNGRLLKDWQFAEVKANLAESNHES